MIILNVGVAKREGEQREGKREIFHLIIHFLDGYSGQGCAMPSTGTRSFNWDSHVVDRGPDTWAIFCCFVPGH